MQKRSSTNILLISITILGFIMRLSYFIGNKFPLHDGGFFYVMVQDLLNNHFILPDFSTFNHANIPFSYPPFGLYFVGIVEYFTKIDRLQLFRMIPLLVSTLSIPAIYFLADELFHDKWISLATSAIYSLLPFSFLWLVMGGGVTRTFGSLFCILALIFVIRYLTKGNWKNAIWGSLFCGLTVLSHPEWAWFLFYSIGIFVLIELFTKKAKILVKSLIIFGGTFVSVLPWMLVICSRFPETLLLPFRDIGFSRWTGVIQLLTLNWSKEALIPVITILAMVGILRSWKKKDWFLIFWLIGVFILQGRAADQKVVIPLALLAGAGLINTVDFFKVRFSISIESKVVPVILIGIYIYEIFGSMVFVNVFLNPISDQDLTSFEWIRQETSPDSKILVLTGKDWIYDDYSEWMTALTDRESVSLIQGYEWLPGFSERISQYYHLQNEYSKGMSDLVGWIKQEKIQVDYLILPKAESQENQISESALHWDDALSFPGVKKSYENESVLILDMRTLTGN